MPAWLRDAARTAPSLLLSVVLLLSACTSPGAQRARSSEPSPTARPTPVVTEDPPHRRTVTAEATIPIDGTPTSFWVDADSVWVGRLDGVTRIDPGTNDILQEIDIPTGAFNFSTGFGSVWVPDFQANVLRRYRVDTGELESEIGGVTTPEDVVATEDAVWVANHRAGTVSRVDPQSNTIVGSVMVAPSGSSGPSNLLVVEDTVWVSAPNLPGVIGIDSATNEVTMEIPVMWPAIPCGEPGIIGHEIWLSSCADGTIVTAANPATGTADRLFDVGGEASQPFEIGGLAWMLVVPADGTDPYLAGVDPESLKIVDAIELPSPGHSATVAFGSLWVLSEQPATVTRIALDLIVGGP